MPEPQAEALAGEHTRWFDDRLATRADLVPLAKSADLRELALRMEARLEASELRLQAQIEANKSEILKGMFGTIGLQTLALLGAVLALAKSLH